MTGPDDAFLAPDDALLDADPGGSVEGVDVPTDRPAAPDGALPVGDTEEGPVGPAPRGGGSAAEEG